MHVMSSLRQASVGQEGEGNWLREEEQGGTQHWRHRQLHEVNDQMCRYHLLPLKL